MRGSSPRGGPLIPLAALAVLLIALPLVALLVGAPWSDLSAAIGRQTVRDALVLSLVSAAITTVVVGLVGVPLGWALARRRRWSIARALVLVPMVLPPVVGGVALQLTWGREGILGGPLFDLLGVTLPFSTVAVLLAQVFVALPFCVLAVEAGVRSVDVNLEDVAQVYGLQGWTLFRRVTLPLARPAVLAGLALSFARALGEFGATITFAGNLPGRTQTMPLAIFVALQQDPASAVLLSIILLGASVAVLIALRGRIGVS